MLLALWLALGMASALMLAEPWILRGAPPPRAPDDRPPRAARVCLWALVAGAFALRLWLAAVYPAHWSELAEVDRSLSIWDFLGGHLSGNFQDRIHAPLQSLVTHAWVWAEEASGARFTLTALRLPSVVFGTLSVLLTARLGRALGSWRAGLGAAALMALTPQPSLISVPMEYYALSATGLAWFAERAATYAYRGRPVYRTLALSAAAALWAGYLNGIVVAPAAAALAVVAWRRRQARGAAYAAALGALLLLPLAALGASGVVLYLRTAGGFHGSGAGLAHPVMDPAQHFSYGSTWFGVARLVTSLLGPAGALAAPLAAALLWRARGRALPLLLAVLAFAFAGSRIAMNLQHYSPAFPAVMLAFAWGADGLPGLGSRPRLRAAVVAALAAAGVVSSHLAWPLRAPISADNMLDYWDRGRFAATVASGPPALPVLLLVSMGSDGFKHELCVGAGGVRARVRCLRRRGEERDALEFQELSGRRVASFRGAEIGRVSYQQLQVELIEAVRRFDSTPPWSTAGWLAVQELPLPGSIGMTSPQVVGVVESRCRRLFRTGAFEVLRCAPAGAQR